MGRAPCCDKANVKRGPWSPEEDAILKNFLHLHGTAGNWISLPQRAGLKRCGKSCRLRWLNYLRPDIKHGAFTEEEDNIIISLFYKMGSRWSVIAANLPGRTDNDVKNHWNTKLKKKLFGGTNNNFNKFNPCNIPKLDVPFIYSTNNNNDINNSSNSNNNNNTNNPTIIQLHPSSSNPTPSPSPSPSCIENNHHHHHHLYVPVQIPTFSSLLAQCNSTTTSPMSFIPNFPNHPYSSSSSSHDPNLGPYYSSTYPLHHQLSSALTVPENNNNNNVGPPPEEVSSTVSGSSSSVIYGSSFEEDPFFAELGFGLVQEVMMNPSSSCNYGDDQQDIKPRGLSQSVAD